MNRYLRLCTSLRAQSPVAVQSRSFISTRLRRHDTPGVTKAVKRLQQLFVEAKDEYEMALESQGTTYAVEDNETARQVAGEL